MVVCRVTKVIWRANVAVKCITRQALRQVKAKRGRKCTAMQFSIAKKL